jgi:hypothetical protein
MKSRILLLGLVAAIAVSGADLFLLGASYGAHVISTRIERNVGRLLASPAYSNVWIISTAATATELCITFADDGAIDGVEKMSPSCGGAAAMMPGSPDGGPVIVHIELAPAGRRS